MDLCQDGYVGIELAESFASAGALRTQLQDWYTSPGPPLKAVLLIGNHPYAYQWVVLHSSNPQIPDAKEEAISFQYYADIDGTFGRSQGYTSPGSHDESFDVHEGDVDWELSVGVLPYYKGDFEKTIQALERYFDRNHAYRTGAYDPPRAFLWVNEHYKATTPLEHDSYYAAMRDGQYSWQPFSNAASARLYFDSVVPPRSVDQGYSDLKAGLVDFTVVSTHGYYGASGKLTINWVETNPVRTAFFWSDGCAVGNLDYADNFLAAVLYSPTSEVLVAKGTTNNSGGMGTNQDGFYGRNVATAMSKGASIGDAIIGHVNVPLKDPWSESREFHYGTAILLGDPTLALLP